MSASELFWVKSFFAIAVAAVGISGALVPWALRKKSVGSHTLAVSDTFAGGVLGGAGLIHLLGDGISQFQRAAPRTAYPLALVLMGVGFLLILLIEGVMVPAHPSTVKNRNFPSSAVQHETAWQPDKPGPVTYPIVLLVVLSVHSIILGLALGAQSSLASAIVIFLAIIAHKGAAGFALGVGYERQGVARRSALPQLAFFSTMTPIGIFVGAGVAAVLLGRADILFEAIFDSLGAGTFFYIAALDIIKTEFDSPEDRLQKWIAAAIGFALMAVLAIWI